MQDISIDKENISESDRISNTCSISNELSETFYSAKKKGSTFYVRLSKDGLLLQRDDAECNKDHHLIQMCDIVGGRCVLQNKQTRFKRNVSCGACTPNTKESKCGFEDNEDVYLYIFAYVLKKKLRSSIRRERNVITLRFRTFDSRDDNLREAEKWYKALKCHRENYLKECACESRGNHVLKRLLVFLNPKSGSGKARELFFQEVVPMLNEAELSYDVYVTKHANYAFDFAKQKDLSLWNGVVAVGGDGLFHEILNGLMQRTDWSKASKILGVIPCGSGNGLARSVAYSYKEPYDSKPLLSSALTIIGGHSTLMDIMKVELENKTIYSFLSVGWGLISDIDIESERLRIFGYKRFTIWTLHRLINLRTYQGKISYLPRAEPTLNIDSCSQGVNKPRLLHSVSCSTFSYSKASSKFNSNDNIADSEYEDIISLQTSVNCSSRSRCDSWLSSCSRKSMYYSIPESVYHSIAENSNNEGNNYNECNEITHTEYDFSPSISMHEPLPSTWIVEEGEFVMVHAACKTHLGSDCLFAPQSQLNDGLMYLVIIRSGITRPQLLNFLINMSTGTHVPTENSEFIKAFHVTAFRLEPGQSQGIITVDGERIEFGALHATIFPKAVRIMVPSQNSSTKHF
uniref:sphingosine kinase n=1 Tax=Glossina morsitans morsitans TaxID=37546 RepID=A0A1B0FA55_GLOMM